MDVLNLINGKIKTKAKLDQIIQNILPHYSFFKWNINLNTCFNNHWLAGFSDASFQIKIVQKLNDRMEVRLNFQIDQKHQDILLLIKNLLGGNIGYRSSQDTYYYGSTAPSFGSKVIQYFDRYHLQSTKHINYLKWRKAYLIIQNKNH